MSANDLNEDRFLEGFTVGLSVAYAENSKARGFSPEEMNHSLLALAESLLARGAHLVFGHDWRPHGVMAAIARLAVRFDPDNVPRGEIVRRAKPAQRWRIHNVLPWPVQPDLPADVRRELEERNILRIQTMPPPAGMDPALPKSDPELARALGLSQLRSKLAEICDARVCLGGKQDKFEGFWPGVFEEAWTIAAREKPLYVSTMLGGAAATLVGAARGLESWDSLLSPRTARERQARLIESRPAVEIPNPDDPPACLRWDLLKERSGLDARDWELLAETSDITVFTALVLKGLHRVQRGRRV